MITILLTLLTNSKDILPPVQMKDFTSSISYRSVEERDPINLENGKLGC